MNLIIVTCIIILITLAILFIVYRVILKKVKELSLNFFGTQDIKEAINKSNIEARNNPRQVYGMDSVVGPLLKKDFPDLNINEIKAMAENAIYKVFESIENKKIEKLDFSSDRVTAYIESYIQDNKDNVVKYDSIKMHKTVLNKYNNDSGVATIHLQTAFEYLFEINDKGLKKVQDRLQTEFIYIIDEKKINDSIKTLGINCPNCGAPIRTKSIGKCEYCGSGIIEEVKHAWILNNIKNI